MAMAIPLQQWHASLMNALFPGRCLACDALFHRRTSHRPGAGDLTDALAPHFCPDCRSQWTEAAPPLCRRCGMVFNSREGEDHLCGRCLKGGGAFTKARAVGIYDRGLRSAIHALKYNAMIQLAPLLGGQLHRAYRRYWQAGDIDLIAPVPLHRKRFRHRGFNQAYLLIAGWRTVGGTVIVRDLLVRQRATPPQTGLDRRQRRVNIDNAFRVRVRGRSAGKRVLLVDDVLTTGATVEACARVLLRDGASRVDVLTLARAQ